MNLYDKSDRTSLSIVINTTIVIQNFFIQYNLIYINKNVTIVNNSSSIMNNEVLGVHSFTVNKMDYDVLPFVVQNHI